MQGEVRATAVAEQLVAENADEAAKAAAKKAKKQKAKTRKQQARSDASTAASEPSAAPSMQSEQDLGHTATLTQGRPAASRGTGSLSDQDAIILQSQLQHDTAQGSAVHALPDHVALDEPR